MEFEGVCWHSDHLDKDMNIRVYGRGGTPVLAFPTQDAMCDNFENFGMINALEPELVNSKIQLFCVDSVDSESWSDTGGDPVYRINRQEAYYNYIIEEVIPFVFNKNKTHIRPIATGCALGGLHAALVVLRRPELFSGLIALSGVYDAKTFFSGWLNGTAYDNSPVDFLSHMPKEHPYVEKYNRLRMAFCVGQGRWEEEGLRTLQIMDELFHQLGVSAWTDYWGYDVDHDWCWWQMQIRYFLPYALGERERYD